MNAEYFTEQLEAMLGDFCKFYDKEARKDESLSDPAAKNLAWASYVAGMERAKELLQHD